MKEIKEELVSFITGNKLSCFNSGKSLISRGDSIFKTRDGKSVFNRVLSKISSGFVFSETSNLWNYFEFTEDFNIIKERQEFFKSLLLKDNSVLKEIVRPRQKWQPKYDVIAVTENEETFMRLQELSCSSLLISSPNELADLERYDIVQIIDCDEFSMMLERLPQGVFIDSIENIYLEKYLEILSAWIDNIEALKRIEEPEIQEIVSGFKNLIALMDNSAKVISKEEIENVLSLINEKIADKIKEMTISGDSLLKIVGEGKLPEELQKIVKMEIEGSGFPEYVFLSGFPVKLDEKEIDEMIRRQSANEFTNLAEIIKGHANDLKKVPEKLKRLEALVVFYDFVAGVSKYLSSSAGYPELSDEFELKAKNMFLDNPQEIYFKLDSYNRCSILTGANSGGKTTLLEHVLQLISLFQIGLPVNGNVRMPIFSDVYYFAKNKGSANKGAFETLLTQLSKIKPGNKTLILADEIEAVTEPGIAGKIISASCDYFIKKNCFLIIATHLGYEIKDTLPQFARIDGIEAKGLDENFELIVDHNPVLGRLAHSTPELIVEKMANTYDDDYFRFLDGFLKRG